jgi:murein DD-endopeptidase MepM/ murein hydrolase activator NlpD
MLRRNPRIPRFPRFPAAVGILGAAALFATSGNWPWARLDDTPVALPIVVSDPYHVVSDTLKSGETIGALLSRQGVIGLDLAGLATALSFDPRRLRAGLVFAVRRDAISDTPTQIDVRPDDQQRIRFIRTAAGSWQGEAIPIRWTTDTIRLAGEISTSLVDAFDREMSEATLDRNERMKAAYELANVNAWSIDFSRDVQPGDRFATVVERLVSEDGEVRFGQVLASDLHINGRQITAYRYTPAVGKPAFYDDEGKALRRAFLAAPVEFRHVSSGFSRRRFHPVLGIYRKHEGIDYAANSGTPVMAAGNGTVIRAGRVGGYGNLVEIRHRDGITTRYAHLSGFGAGIRAGVGVTQGQVIGRVGMTGTATGPHLHYEFRVNGVARDPRSMKFEAGEPIAPSDRPAFQAQRQLLATLLQRGGAPAPASAPLLAD